MAKQLLITRDGIPDLGIATVEEMHFLDPGQADCRLSAQQFVQRRGTAAHTANDEKIRQFQLSAIRVKGHQSDDVIEQQVAAEDDRDP